MTRVALSLFFLASIFLAGCDGGVTAHEDEEMPGKGSGLDIEANQENGAYCFYEVRYLVEDRTLEASDVRLALLRAINKPYENGEILLSPLARNGIIYYAEPCDRQVVERIILDFDMAVSQSNYTRYKEEYVKAHASYSRTNPYKELGKVTTPIIDDRFEDRAYCFFEMHERTEDRTLDASDARMAFLDVRTAILRTIEKKYESDELFLQPLSVGRVIYYAESCNRQIVEPIILEYGMEVTQSSYTKYTEAYAAAIANTGGFEIDN